MNAVRPSAVTVTLRYEVDCKVCGEGVETDTEIRTRADAEEARQNHLREHAAGDWD